MNEKAHQRLSMGTVVDLTHAFSPSIPVPPGLPRAEIEEIYEGAVQIFTHVGQYGTHLDAPGHFHKNMRLVHEIPAREFILDGCVIDISPQALKDSDYQLRTADVLEWEEINGPVPPECLVILKTGWSVRWSDPKAFLNQDADGRCHYPGWGMEAVQYLIEKRNIRAVAHETPDTDSGFTCGPDRGWPVESYVLGQDRWQIENLNLSKGLPSKGFLVFVGVPKGEGATGFPVRVLAMLF
jgi:kynurenine formamidase